MADLLTSPKFAFPANQVVLLTNPAPPRPRPGVLILPAAQTDRDGILAAMQKYLVDLPQRGDTVVFYDASHGSLRANSKGSKLTVPLPQGGSVHADSTLVPADAYKGGYDIRDREMNRIFNAALDKGIHLTVILDSCHSGGLSRGIGPKYHARTLPFDPRDIAEGPDLLDNGQPRPLPTRRSDNPALVFAAAQPDQSANEQPPDTTTEIHGYFTAALVTALEALPSDAPAAVINQRVMAVLRSNNPSPQDPDLDATDARRQQPLFGGNAAASDKVHAAALMTGEDGNIWLDAGRVSGIGVGSEFTSIIPNGDKQTVTLRVTDLRGIARSIAAIASPAGATVSPGDVFELTKWVPADFEPLLVWHWPSNLSQDDIAAAVAQINAAGITSVTDPAEEPWTHILWWDGTNWMVQKAGAPAPILLGAKLTAITLKQHLPAAKLWVNLPPPRELAAKLVLDDHNNTVQTSADLAHAHYILAGVLSADGPAYAWFHNREFADGPRKLVTTDHTPGCSTTSPYPVRSKWVALAGAKMLNDAAEALNGHALRLAKVHGWLTLGDSPADASATNYYTLELVHASDEKPLAPDDSVRQCDRLKLGLWSSPPPEPAVRVHRWVYVFDIDCQGEGTLLYPLDNSGNQFPKGKGTYNEREFVLPGSEFHITPSYGLDTYILLSTADPLSDQYVLNFKGMAARGAPGLESPLEKLLADTNSGVRGFPKPVSTNWGISSITHQSIQVDSAKPTCSDAAANP
jgi:hypothetical protein